MSQISACTLPPGRGAGAGPDLIVVRSVLLLGVHVTACAVLNRAEHERRESAGIGPVTDPDLLGRLLDLPGGEPARDLAWWAESLTLPAGIMRRGEDGRSVTRLLQPPLVLDDVVVPGPRGRELRAVQDASLFAGFTPRWVAAERAGLPDTVILEAKLTGVGLLGPGARVLLPAEQLARPVDGWAWLLWEKTYRRWLKERAPASRAGCRDRAVP